MRTSLSPTHLRIALALLWVTVPCSVLHGQALLPSPGVTRAERIEYYLQRTYGWQRMSWLGVDTAIDHLLNDPEWGRGPGGYACQYASGFGRRVVGNSVEFGVGLLLNEDIGFHSSHRSGLAPRIRYAATHAFLARVPGGGEVPAYARYAGIMSTALVAPAWHHRKLSGSGFALDTGFSALDQLENSFLAEFTPDLKHFGRRVWRRVARLP